MKSLNYPITVYLKDAKKRNDNLPLSLNLIGEADTWQNIDGRIKESKVILSLEGMQWYAFEFIENNYICTPNKPEDSKCDK